MPKTPEPLRIEYRPVDSIVEYVRNPRKNDDQVDRMVASIHEFGFRIPLMIKSDGSLVDGHLRLKAARRIGMKDVPVTLADDLSEAQIKAFRLLANKSASWAEWDNDLLKLELDDLADMDFAIQLTGFTDLELDGIMGAEPTSEAGGTSSAKEIDPDEFQMGHRCPRCGFEFDG